MQAQQPSNWNIWQVILLVSLAALTVLVAALNIVWLVQPLSGVSGGSPAPGEAPAPTEPQPAPIVHVLPAEGRPGTMLTVVGEYWRPDSSVTVYLETVDGDLYREAFSSARVDALGRWSVAFAYPNTGFWATQRAVLVRAETMAGQSAGAAFLLRSLSTVLPTATPSAVTDPTATLLPPTATPSSTITPSPTPNVPRTTADLNLRRRPDTSGEIIRVLMANTPLEVIGQWLYVRGGGQEGWVSRAYTTFSGTAPLAVTPTPLPTATATPSPTPTITPSPTATATPTSQPVIREWRGEYWPNKDLYGNAVLLRNDPVISFNWGSGSPAANVPADNFSVRWTRSLYFERGTYRFRVTVDDGVRVWVDDALIIDAWTDGSPRTFTADLALAAGNHALRVEYYERGGSARIDFAWDQVSNPSFPHWQGQYWPNKDLYGTPVLIRNDRRLDFNWGNSAPAVGLPNDYFSVRWSRRLEFAPGRYRFTARANDGLRFYIDGQQLMNEWHSHDGSTEYVVDNNLYGIHTLVVEYFDNTREAFISLDWERLGDVATPSPTPNPTVTATPPGQNVEPTPIPIATATPSGNTSLSQITAIPDVSQAEVLKRPQLDGNVLDLVTKETVLSVWGRSPDGQWIAVQAADSSQIGWVERDLLQLSRPLEDVPVLVVDDRR